MSHADELAEIKAHLEAPSTHIGGKDPEIVRYMRWLIALVESQGQEIEQLKLSASLTSPMQIAGDRLSPDERRVLGVTAISALSSVSRTT